MLQKALVELKKNEPNYKLIGMLLTELHVVLRDIFDISTPKIESMLDAAMNAGALGGKITGSGGGGGGQDTIAVAGSGASGIIIVKYLTPT